MSDVRLARLRRVAYWLDAGIPVPGTSWRFGLDPILGLVPGLGDAVGGFLAGWILIEALRLGVSGATLGRLVANVTIDVVVGAVPVLGDAFDFAWKANLTNVALLERHAADPIAARTTDRRYAGVVVGAFLLVCAGLIAGALALLRALLF